MTDKRSPLKKESLAILKERGVPVGTILDVGVQTGTFELISAFPDLKHMLFEPVEEFFPAIEKNYARVPHELVKAAISDETGSVTLKTSRKLQGMDISHSSMVFGDAPEGTETRTVPMARLDDLLKDRQLPGPYLLKIDIDGHEMRALKGAAETLKKCSVVIVECVHSTLPQRMTHVLNAGFRLFDLAEPCYYDKVFWQCDAIFLRKDVFAAHFKELGSGAVTPGLYQTFR